MDPGSFDPAPEWVFFNGGAEITQFVNSRPGIAIGNDRMRGIDYEGTFYIDDSDDDYVGVVFGYQDNTHFYLVNWKKRDQSFVSWQRSKLLLYNFSVFVNIYSL